MKIADSTVLLGASHASQQRYELKERLRAWIGNASSEENGGRRALPERPPAASSVQLSDAGKATQSNEADAIQQGIDAANNDPRLKLLRAMIALLTGKDVNILDLSDYVGDATPATPPQQSAATTTNTNTAPQSAGYGVEYERHESYSESEQTSFSATGIVRTSDGKEIRFDLSLSLSRSYQVESSTSLRLGDARQKRDPLIVNFAGTAAQLTSQRFRFDLDADGKGENINFATGGSGFLAIDRNGDGKIGDGSELFGASSGNGFAELAQFDSDHNGWIDENDSAYAQLRVWSKDEAGNDRIVSLKQADVGAINVTGVDSPFSFKDGNNDLQAQVRASSVFLSDSGRAGSVQQVDLTV